MQLMEEILSTGFLAGSLNHQQYPLVILKFQALHFVGTQSFTTNSPPFYVFQVSGAPNSPKTKREVTFMPAEGCGESGATRCPSGLRRVDPAGGAWR